MPIAKKSPVSRSQTGTIMTISVIDPLTGWHRNEQNDGSRTSARRRRVDETLHPADSAEWT
jgi:hypothetical protein